MAMANPIVPAVILSPLDPQPSGIWLRKLHIYLIRPENVIGNILTKIHNVLGISKSVLLNISIDFIVVVLIFANTRVQMIVSTILSVCYPIYCSCRMMIGKVSFNRDMLTKWLLFWTIYAMFEFVVIIYIEFFY